MQTDIIHTLMSPECTEKAILINALVNVSNSSLILLYDLSKCCFTRTIDCALEGPSLDSLQGLATTQMKGTEVPNPHEAGWFTHEHATGQ